MSRQGAARRITDQGGFLRSPPCGRGTVLLCRRAVEAGRSPQPSARRFDSFRRCATPIIDNSTAEQTSPSAPERRRGRTVEVRRPAPTQVGRSRSPPHPCSSVDRAAASEADGRRFDSGWGYGFVDARGVHEASVMTGTRVVSSTGRAVEMSSASALRTCGHGSASFSLVDRQVRGSSPRRPTAPGNRALHLLWCNGSTPGCQPGSPGSSPGGTTVVEAEGVEAPGCEPGRSRCESGRPPRRAWHGGHPGLIPPGDLDRHQDARPGPASRRS